MARKEEFMLNQIILVGRLTKEVHVNNSDSGKKVAKINKHD